MNIAILSKTSIYNVLKQKYTHTNLYSYENIDEINFLNFKNYDYIVVINLLFYINMSALKEFLEQEKPMLAGLPTYWGIGTHHVAIINTSLFNNVTKKNLNIDIPENNLICKLFLKAIKINNLSKILIKSKKNTQYLCIKNNIINLSNKVYSINKINARGHYHNSIFINHTDDCDYFLNWYNEYETKQKNVFIDDKIYKTIIGVTFFIIQKKHVVLLGKNNFYFWGSNNFWTKINSKKKMAHIIEYVKKSANATYGILSLGDI